MTIIDPNTLVAFWNQDCFSQSDFIDRLKQYMRDSVAYVKENTTSVVRLNQSTEPTQFEWEQAWLAQTGKTLPISPNGSLLWFNTKTNEFGGEYGTTENLSTVYRREPLYPKGAVVYHNNAFLITTQANLRVGIGASQAYYPSLTFTIRQTCDVILTFQAAIAYNGGASQSLGVDFELNGQRVSTTYFTGLSSTNALVAYPPSAAIETIQVSAPILNLPAGTYLVQALMGQTTVGGYSDIGIGGATRGARILTVKAIAK